MADRSGALMSMSLRLAVLALLGVALWNPGMPWGRAPLDVIVLLDDSLSIDRSAVEESWRRLAHAAQALPAEGRLSVIRFAASPVMEAEAADMHSADGMLPDAPPRVEPLDRSETDIASALHEALARVRLDRRSVIVLVSDGAQTKGDAAGALAALKAAGIPVVALPAAPSRMDQDAWVESLHVPSHARVGEVIRIGAILGSHSDAQGVLHFRMNGNLLASQTVALRADERVSAGLDAPLRMAGAHLFQVQLERFADPRVENNTREALVRVEGPPRVLYLSRAPESPLLLRSLRDGKWDVAAVHPAEFTRSTAGLPPPALVVLDDVAIEDMPADAWRSLDAMVRYDGSGLLVLGGPRSFAAGGYRHSVLEDLLPVTAEGREPRNPAAVLFVVDVSGSMEQDREGHHRLTLARRAIIETLRLLPGTDLVGVSSFAIEPREILPLGHHHDPLRALETDFPAASGGTRLLPALEYAVDRLARTVADQRLLVLVTDGFVERTEFRSVERAIANAKIDVIALAVGADVQTDVLDHLAAIGSGTVLRVDDVASLPRLMSQAVEMHREPAELGPFHPRTVAALPFPLDLGNWPRLTGYMVSRARESATVYLESEQGDPLLAAHHVGTGRVAVLPGGLGSWAEEWVGWSAWGRFAGGLSQWLARPSENPQLDVRVVDQPDGLAVVVDALSADGEWSTDSTAQITVVDPVEHERTLDVAAVAPGRFATTIPAGPPGQYRVVVRVGDQVSVRHVLRLGDRELRTGARTSDPLRDWQSAGLLSLWPENGQPAALRARSLQKPTRSWLILLALATYVALLVFEETRA